MSKHLPMAIDASIPFNQCQFKLFNVDNNSLFCRDLLVEVNHKLIESTIAYFLGLDITKVEEMAVTKIDLNYAYSRNCMFGLTLDQVQQLFATTDNPVANKYRPILSELIFTQVLPIFNRHDKKEIITMSTKLSTENNSQKFHNDLFGDLTVLTHQDGSLWFIGKEVATKLGYVDTDQAIRQHCKHPLKQRVKLNQNDTRGSDMWIIPESDLYRLVMRSKLPDAEKFETWVVDDILPSIRKTGSYGQIENKKPVKTIRHTNASAMRAADRMIEKMTISDERKTLARAYLLQKEYDIPVETMLPTVVHKLSATEIGKQLGISANMVGRITNELHIKDNPELCERRLDKSPHSNKDVESCYYAPSVVEMVRAKLNERKAS